MSALQAQLWISSLLERLPKSYLFLRLALTKRKLGLLRYWLFFWVGLVLIDFISVDMQRAH